MVRLYQSFREEQQSSLDDSAQQFGDTLYQIDDAMDSSSRLFNQNDADVVALEQERDQHLIGISAAAPQLQQLLNFRK